MKQALLVLVILQIVVLIVLVFLAWDLRQVLYEEKAISQHGAMRIPTRFVFEEPECADRLLEIMEIDHINIRSDN